MLFVVNFFFFLACELSNMLPMLQANDDSWKQLGFIRCSHVTKHRPRATGTTPCCQPRGHLVPVANGVGGGQWLPQSHAVREGRAGTCVAAVLDHGKIKPLIIFLTEVCVIYKLVLISAVWQTFSDPCTHTLAFSYSFPLRFITGYRAWFPMVFTGRLLLTRPLCVSLRLLIPASQSFPPLPWQPQVCSLSMSLFTYVEF